MKQTFVYFQPEYVSKFKCNGQACDAHCCKRWRIDIDKKTYKKYSHLKPKSAAQEITSHLQENEQLNCYTVKLDNRGFCPMLTEDNWCKIQRTYGEEYLSNTCVTYPRITRRLGDFYERALTLTCPEVAITLLMFDEPITFEQTEVSKKVHDNLERISIQSPPTWISKILIPHIVTMQTAAISILELRSKSRRLKNEHSSTSWTSCLLMARQMKFQTWQRFICLKNFCLKLLRNLCRELNLILLSICESLWELLKRFTAKIQKMQMLKIHTTSMHL